MILLQSITLQKLLSLGQDFQLTKNDNGLAYKSTWKSKLPKKNRIFVWLVAQGAILTKDNMLKKIWKGDQGVIFVDH
jgi:type V secretory pathway adhesin AidA